MVQAMLVRIKITPEDNLFDYTFLSDAPRAQRGASRKLKLIFHSVPLHSLLQGGAFSVHTGNK
jgi:hypothetical protein